MRGVHLLDKARGETLSELLERFKKTNRKYGGEPITYAGRLDPMAEGLVILLSGETVHEKDLYLGMNKTYVVDILFGFATDTGDVLGELTVTPSRTRLPNITLTAFVAAVQGVLGTHTDPYPVYSSKPVNSVPLFQLARSGKLEDIEIPEHTYAILSAEAIGLRQVQIEELLLGIERDIQVVKGDFRQEHIISLWKEHTRVLYELSFDVGTLRVEATSGAYMRGIAEKIGKALGVPALALRIRRERIGEYSLPKLKIQSK
jgi:tRNA pseudouridine55 synthase